MLEAKAVPRYLVEQTFAEPLDLPADWAGTEWVRRFLGSNGVT